ncbi:sulfotransferase family protein [Novosphingobium panipatense]|uniref:Sulfotransferase family protein n=1 Tax=Novosphingobium panipatense TaxID=428991 RepID=A0ABY1PXV9_9SPHN|nr:sulfotransferase [Novosphingobium panipatense]SMP51257.1 Sulfotransferase family protein [Novosphingobium panipatense]
MDLRYDPPAAFRHSRDQLHDLVSAETGLHDFGPADYLSGLTVLLQSMDYDPRFSDQGRRIAWGMVVGVLRGRAQAIASMKANPGFDAKPVLSPVVITGVPRTGTTALHRLLAVDPRFQGLQTWLLDSPMPRPPREEWARYPQYRSTVAALDAQYAAVPGAKAAHFRAAEEVHECCMVLRQSFVSNLWSCAWSAATYDAWWQCQSEAEAYRHYARCVQLIGLNDPDRRWLLKNPGHIEHLDLLLAVFPDARVIQTHRDPGKAIPSLVSLLMNLNGLTEPDRTQQRAENLLRREVAKWAQAVRKCEAVRARHPGQVLDVVHADFHARPMETVEAIYRFIGMDIPEATRAALLRRIEEKPELGHGVHRYAIEDYGMTADEARAPFGDYIARYDLLERASLA